MEQSNITFAVTILRHFLRIVSERRARPAPGRRSRRWLPRWIRAAIAGAAGIELASATPAGDVRGLAVAVVVASNWSASPAAAAAVDPQRPPARPTSSWPAPALPADPAPRLQRGARPGRGYTRASCTWSAPPRRRSRGSARQWAPASSWPGVPAAPAPRRRRCARPDLPIRQAPRGATAFEGYGAWMRRS